MAQREIWVIAEFRRGALTRGTQELLGAARTLDKGGELAVVAVLVGRQAAAAESLAALGPKVLWLQSPALEAHESSRVSLALARLAEARGRPAAILTGATATGLELLPRLAAQLGVGVASHVTALRWEGDSLHARRPIFGGRAYEEVALLMQPAMVTVRAGAFAAVEKAAAAGAIEPVPIEMPVGLGLTVVDRKITSAGRQELTEASRVVAGGRGLGQKENFAKLEELAAVLDGTVGASRAVVDAGWRSHDEQVGKSGKTISPQLYIGCGISGALHHTMGMDTSKTIIAINKDPAAPIFNAADYGIVDDVFTILPLLKEELTKAKE